MSQNKQSTPRPKAIKIITLFILMATLNPLCALVAGIVGLVKSLGSEFSLNLMNDFFIVLVIIGFWGTLSYLGLARNFYYLKPRAYRTVRMFCKQAPFSAYTLKKLNSVTIRNAFGIPENDV